MTQFEEHDFKAYLWDIYGQTVCHDYGYHYVYEPEEHSHYYTALENYVDANVNKLELIVRLGEYLSK